MALFCRHFNMKRLNTQIRFGALLVLLAFLISGCTSAASVTGLGTDASAAASTAAAASGSPDSTATADFFAMNTYMMITANGPEAQAAADAAKEEVYILETELSNKLTDSEITQININSGKGPVAVSQETFDIIAEAAAYSEKTDGAFDITIAPIMDIWGFSDSNYRVPTSAEIAAALPLVGWKAVMLDEGSLTVELPVTGMKLDLGGIAKGYASDKVHEIMKGYDITSGLISLGGNVAVFGTKADGSPWRIAIADPQAPESYIGVLSSSDISVITSGGYERNFTQDGVTYMHIMNPETGSPVQSDLLSVSIITASGVQGDSLSTALFVMGKDKAIAFWQANRDFECILVTTAGEVFASAGLKDTFKLTDTAAALNFFE